MSLSSDFKPLLANHNFLKLWTAQIVSAVGDRLTQMAMLGLISGAAANQTLNDLVAISLPPAIAGICVSPFAVMILDRVNRKHVLVCADTLRGAMVLLIPFAFFGPYKMLVVQSLIFITAMSASLHSTTQAVVTPQIVGRENLLTANSVASATGLISALVGFALVGPIVKRLDNTTNFIIGGVIYFCSAMLMARLTIPRVTAQTKMTFQQVLGDLRTGMKLVLTEKSVRRLAFLNVTFWCIGGFMFVSFFALMTKEYGLKTKDDADLFGIMITFVGIGLLLGAFGISRFKNIAYSPRLPYIALVALGLSIALWANRTQWWLTACEPLAARVAGWDFPLSVTDLLSRAVKVLVPSLGLMGLGCVGAAFLLPVDTSLQRRVPDEILGRVQGARTLITGIGFCSAVVLAGWLAQQDNLVWGIGGKEVFRFHYDASRVIVGFGFGIAIIAAVGLVLGKFQARQNEMPSESEKKPLA